MKIYCLLLLYLSGSNSHCYISSNSILYCTLLTVIQTCTLSDAHVSSWWPVSELGCGLITELYCSLYIMLINVLRTVLWPSPSLLPPLVSWFSLFPIPGGVGPGSPIAILELESHSLSYRQSDFLLCYPFRLGWEAPYFPLADLGWNSLLRWVGLYSLLACLRGITLGSFHYLALGGAEHHLNHIWLSLSMSGCLSVSVIH